MTETLPARRDAPVKVDLSQPLTDLDQALRLADALSKSDLVPQSLHGKPASVLHVLLTGQNLGLHWSESVRVIYSPGPGQIGLRGQFLLYQLRKAKHTYRFEDGDGWAKFFLHRGDTGEDFETIFTRADAEKANLTARANWKQYEKRMLRWRACGECVSFAAPEVLLGFEMEGAEEVTPEQEIQLRPQSPAPPEPAGKAAPGPQAEQAEQLRELDEKMREPESPDMGGNSPDEPAGDTFPREKDEAEAVIVAEPEQEQHPSDKAKTVVLAEQFTALGWNPQQYRPQVLHACSVFAGRRITGVRGLKTQEVLALTNALSLIRRTFDEEAYPVALADQVEAWRARWAETDPDGYTAYEAPGDV